MENLCIDKTSSNKNKKVSKLYLKNLKLPIETDESDRFATIANEEHEKTQRITEKYNFNIITEVNNNLPNTVRNMVRYKTTKGLNLTNYQNAIKEENHEVHNENELEENNQKVASICNQIMQKNNKNGKKHTAKLTYNKNLLNTMSSLSSANTTITNTNSNKKSLILETFDNIINEKPKNNYNLSSRTDTNKVSINLIKDIKEEFQELKANRELKDSKGSKYVKNVHLNLVTPTNLTTNVTSSRKVGKVETGVKKNQNQYNKFIGKTKTLTGKISHPSKSYKK